MSEARQKPAAARGPRRPHPLVELTRARLVEFVREPEAVFWVFVFPVLLALATGARRRPLDDHVHLARAQGLCGLRA